MRDEPTWVSSTGLNFHRATVTANASKQNQVLTTRHRLACSNQPLEQDNGNTQRPNYMLIMLRAFVWDIELRGARYALLSVCGSPAYLSKPLQPRSCNESPFSMLKHPPDGDSGYRRCVRGQKNTKSQHPRLSTQTDALLAVTVLLAGCLVSRARVRCSLLAARDRERAATSKGFSRRGLATVR